MELNIPAIKGIGDSLIYLVDRYPVDGAGVSIYDIDFVPIAGVEQRPQGAGLATIDHLTHNVHRGRMDEWASFYERLFNFREVRYFDIEGKLTGLKSKAMTSPCGKIRIPINESSDDKSQIQEYLVAYHGEGIQHIALGTGDIYDTVHTLRQRGVAFQDTPDTYYEALADAASRAPGGRRPPEEGAHPPRWRARKERNAAADLHDHRDRTDLLRDHPAQGQRGLRRRQFPGAVRVDRAGPDPARRAEGLRAQARATPALEKPADQTDVLTPLGFALLRRLADGEIHSGEALATRGRDVARARLAGAQGSGHRGTHAGAHPRPRLSAARSGSVSRSRRDRRGARRGGQKR